jgi:hypothetical protein
LNIVCILLGISPVSDCDLPTFRNLLSVPSSKAGCRVLYTQPLKMEIPGEIPKRIHTININSLLHGVLRDDFLFRDDKPVKVIK